MKHPQMKAWPRKRRAIPPHSLPAADRLYLTHLPPQHAQHHRDALAEAGDE